MSASLLRPADEGRPEVSVIVVSWNTRDILRECLASIRTHLSGFPHEVIVVDNGSTDGSVEMVLAEFPDARLIRNTRNEGFGCGNNRGMSAARGEFFLLLNSDARLQDDSCQQLVALMRRQPSVGVTAPRLLFADGRLQTTANRFPSLPLILFEALYLYRLLPRRVAGELLLGGYWEHARGREVDWLVGAFLIVRRAVFVETGGFDPAIFLYGEEVEWCYRIRARGWKILFAPVGNVQHLGHASADVLMGTAGRVDKCLLAADALVSSWHGPLAGFAAATARIAGALIRLAAFSIRRLWNGDTYGEDVRAASRLVLAHYRRRATAAVSRGVGRRGPGVAGPADGGEGGACSGQT